MEMLRGRRKILTGRVLSDRMQKTVIVEVERKYRHPVYKKVVRARKKYKVHNPDNIAHTDDFVEMMETRPLSKEKRWRLVRVIRKAKSGEEMTNDKAQNSK